MKKKLLSLVLLFAFPACLKRKNNEQTAPVKTEKPSKTRATIAFEELDDFELEDDEADNIFNTDNAGKPVQDIDFVEVDVHEKGDTVNFDFDRTAIKEQEKAKIDHNAQEARTVLAKNKDAVVVVNGHSCKIAKSKSYNHMISQERANNVKEAYVERGVEEKRVKAIGHGDSQPITQAKGKAGQAPNRRAETHYLKNS